MGELIGAIIVGFASAFSLSGVVSAGVTGASARAQERAARDAAAANMRRAYLATFRKTTIPSVERVRK